MNIAHQHLPAGAFAVHIYAFDGLPTVVLNTGAANMPMTLHQAKDLHSTLGAAIRTIKREMQAHGVADES